MADYDNLRKRTAEEKEVWTRFLSQRILLKLLPILDILEAAEKHFNDKGLVLAVEGFKKVLKEEELEEIKPKVGEFFDHEIHEAVELKAGGKKGQIAELVLTGWKFINGPVLRFARVKVYGDKTGKEEELEKEMARKDYM